MVFAWLAITVTDSIPLYYTNTQLIITQRNGICHNETYLNCLSILMTFSWRWYRMHKLFTQKHVCQYFAHPIPHFKSEITVCFIMQYNTFVLREGNMWYEACYKFTAVNFQQLPSLVKKLLMVFILYRTCNSKAIRKNSLHYIL
jgi:hypothetical protein